MKSSQGLTSSINIYMKNIIKALFLSSFLVLSGCGGGGSPSVYVPPVAPITPVIPTTPPALPPQGTLAFQGNFTGPNIGLKGYCDSGVPTTCNLLPGGIYGTFQVPGNSGEACQDPGPNICYSAVNGLLALSAANATAFPLITGQTFSNTGSISIQASISALCYAPDCWGGIVLYNGDLGPSGTSASGDWRGLYYSQGPSPNTVEIKVWSPTVVTTLTNQVYPYQSSHILRMDYLNGVFTYYVDGVMVATEKQGSWSPDTTTMLNPPHAAIFLGDIYMQLTSFQVYTGN